MPTQKTASEITFVVYVTQFLRPTGKRERCQTSLPISVKTLYDDMVKSGCCFESEVLTTREVSTTISNGNDDIDTSITPNGPQVGDGMIKMLKQQSWKGAK